MSTLTLINPTVEMGVEAVAMTNEVGCSDWGFQGLKTSLNLHSFPEYVAKLLDEAAGMNLPPGFVPMNTYWLLRGANQLIGISRLRHRLTDALLRHSGHIGYWIRPAERGKGYGTCLLSLTCQKAAGLGIDRALLTCYRGNVRSIRVIEVNGGVLDTSTSSSPDDSDLHFWISTKTAQPAIQYKLPECA